MDIQIYHLTYQLITLSDLSWHTPQTVEGTILPEIREMEDSDLDLEEHKYRASKLVGECETSVTYCLKLG